MIREKREKERGEKKREKGKKHPIRLNFSTHVMLAN